MLRKLLAGATTVLVASALSLIAVAAPASATGLQPLADLHGFTVLTEGDATMSSSSETEGAWAVGGALTVNQKYDLASMHNGAPLPSVGGQGTQLLVNGKILFGTSGEALDVNQGVTRVGDTSGYEVTQNNRFSTTADDSTYVRTAGSTDLASVSASGVFASTFANAFTNLRANSTTIAGLTSTTATVLSLIDGTNFNGISGNDKGLQLTSGAVNVLHVTAAQLSAISNIKFIGGTMPSSSTPLYIDVTDSGNVTVSIPDVLNADASAVLYNFSGATSLQFGGPDKIDGSILAPNAAVTHTGATFEGQIAAKSFTDSSNREIHHIGFGGGLPQTVSGSVSQKDVCADGSNALTVNAVTGVTYHWTSAPADQTTGADFTSYSNAAIAPGTYSFSISANGGYALTGDATYSHTFSASTTCPVTIQTAPSANPPSCTADGTISYPTQTDVTWSTSPAFSGHGTYMVTAQSTHPITGQTQFTVVVDAKGTGLNCTPSKTCLPDTAVSYTYDGNPASPTANSGLITVTQLDASKYTDTLCQGFWVTAASWVYTGTGMWPQNLDKSIPANSGNEITQVGTYAYGAPVGCGQGDIYASTTQSPAPYGPLTAPSTTYQEYFLHQFVKDLGFTGPNPTYLNEPFGCNIVTPQIPHASAVKACGTTGSIDIPSDTATITYTHTGDNDLGAYTVTAKTTVPHTFDDGTLTRTWDFDLGTYQDCVVPKATIDVGACTSDSPTASSEAVSFTLNNVGSTRSVTFTISSTTLSAPIVVPVGAGAIGHATASAPEAGASYVITYDSGTSLTTLTVDKFDGCKQGIPGDPKATPATCIAGVVTGGSIFVDVKNGLIYTIDGPKGFHLSPVTQQDNAVTPGTYTVSVKADTGFVLDTTGSHYVQDGTTGIWTESVDVGSPAGCGLVTPKPATADKLVGCNTGSYTLPDDSNVAWYVTTGSGSPLKTAAGTYPVNDLVQDVAIHIEAKPANGTVGLTGTQAWDFDFTQPVDGCTTTLADLPTQVDHADASCQTNGSSAGSITVGPSDSLPYVNYFINGTQVSGATTVLAAGVYQVTAAVNQSTAAGDTLDDAGPWTVTIAAGSTVACADLTTLALTGGNSLGWIALAAILLQLGLALLVLHILWNRRRGQHLA